MVRFFWDMSSCWCCWCVFFLWHEFIDAFLDSLHRRSAVCRAFAHASGDVPEGEQETARLPGERVRQGTSWGKKPLFLVVHGLQLVDSILKTFENHGSTLQLYSWFHIKTHATIEAYYNQWIFTGHIHWVSLISSHSGWGLKTQHDHIWIRSSSIPVYPSVSHYVPIEWLRISPTISPSSVVVDPPFSPAKRIRSWRQDSPAWTKLQKRCTEFFPLMVGCSPGSGWCPVR